MGADRKIHSRKKRHDRVQILGVLRIVQVAVRRCAGKHYLVRVLAPLRKSRCSYKLRGTGLKRHANPSDQPDSSRIPAICGTSDECSAPYARTCASVAAETRICGSTDARPVIYKTPASWLAERYDTYDCMLSMAVMRSLGIGGAKSSVNIFGSLSRPSNTAPTALLSRMGKEAVIS